MIEFLTLDDVLESHREQLHTYGGAEGVRDWGLLHSAIAQPEVRFANGYLHTDLFEMAAAYLFHLVCNHPFVDGNKRVGLEAALLFLELNGISLEVADELLYGLVIEAAQGDRSKAQIANDFRNWCQ